MRIFCAFVVILLFQEIAFAQHPVGQTQVTNFTKINYKGGNQNWDIQQDKSGIMYFANNEGLLTFDGERWKLYPTPNKTVVRSLQLAADGRIYIGAQDEIGYFYPDKLGILQYHSLRALIPAGQRSFNDVWNVVITRQSVLFRSNTEILEYAKGKIHCFPADPGWLFLGQAGNRVFAQQNADQLVELQGGNWITCCHLTGKSFITSIVPYSRDTLLVATLKDGLFLLTGGQLIRKKTSLDGVFAGIRINTVKQISTGLYAIGSGYNGCYIMNRAGQLIQSFSEKESLQKNNVRSLFLDRNKNIWLGLDDGISYIAYNSAIRQIYPDQNRQPATFSVSLFGGRLYLGTSDALFSMPLTTGSKDLSDDSGQFTEIPGTKGQIWNVAEAGGRLFMGNEDGGYELGQNGQPGPASLTKVVPAPGTWIFRPLSATGPGEILAGTYTGLSLLRFEKGHVTYWNYPEIKESLRFMTVDYSSATIWTSHPYRGVYRIRLSTDKSRLSIHRLYTQKDGLPSALHNYVYLLHGRNIVATEKGIYEYDAVTDRFKPSAYFLPVFHQHEIQFLKEDKEGDIWFISNKRVGVIDFKKNSALAVSLVQGRAQTPGRNPVHDGLSTPSLASAPAFTVVYFPELTARVLAGFENIYPYDKQNVFIGSNKGVFHLNYQEYLRNSNPINVLLDQVRLTGERDSVIFGGYSTNTRSIVPNQAIASVPGLRHAENSVSFEFSSTLFEQHGNIEYSYKLAGFDTRWSAWASKSEKDYTNLNFGPYTFLVKARNNLGNESPAVSYAFKIKPAWYQTWYSGLFYVSLLAGLIHFVMQQLQQKHDKKELSLKYLHKLELEHIENELTSLKNSKLETDISHKNKELATATMHLLQRGKLLSKIKEGISPLTKDAVATENKTELTKVMRLINDAERNDSDWEHFAVHFDQIHSDYLSTLKSKFPDLSPSDLKMCAYLKLNLASKEIAQLMSVTIRAVEVSRYRLRKKLNVTSNTNLFDFLVRETGTVRETSTVRETGAAREAGTARETGTAREAGVIKGAEIVIDTGINHKEV